MQITEIHSGCWPQKTISGVLSSCLSWDLLGHYTPFPKYKTTHKISIHTVMYQHWGTRPYWITLLKLHLELMSSIIFHTILNPLLHSIAKKRFLQPPEFSVSATTKETIKWPASFLTNLGLNFWLKILTNMTPSQRTGSVNNNRAASPSMSTKFFKYSKA